MKIAMMGSIHDDGWKLLKQNNFEVFEITDFENSFLKKELVDVDAIALRTAKLNSEVLSSCKKLKIVSRHGVGYDNVDKKFLDNNKIALGITGTANAVAVAEHVISMFFYLIKKIHLSDKLTKEGKFIEKNTLEETFEIYNKNILIIGFGRIGRALAKRCLGFDSKVFVYDPYIKNSDVEKYNCQPINKEEGLKIADYISIHLPLNQKTKNFISANEFSLVKKNLIIVNTSRGGIINEKALALALKENRIAGAGIDVFEVEPPPINHPYFNLNNIVLSPHNAALTLECKKRMAVEVCKNIINFLTKNEKLNINNIVNSEILNLN